MSPFIASEYRSHCPACSDRLNIKHYQPSASRKPTSSAPISPQSLHTAATCTHAQAPRFSPSTGLPATILRSITRSSTFLSPVHNGDTAITLRVYPITSFRAILQRAPTAPRYPPGRSPTCNRKTPYLTNKSPPISTIVGTWVRRQVLLDTRCATALCSRRGLFH